MKPYLTTNEQKAVFEFISRIKVELSEELIFARLFGSKARGDFDSESDIDILLIVREYKNSVIEKIVDAQVDCLLEYNANISPVVFSENEYKKNKELGSPFFRNIEQEGTVL